MRAPSRICLPFTKSYWTSPTRKSITFFIRMDLFLIKIRLKIVVHGILFVRLVNVIRSFSKWWKKAYGFWWGMAKEPYFGKILGLVISVLRRNSLGYMLYPLWKNMLSLSVGSGMGVNGFGASNGGDNFSNGKINLFFNCSFYYLRWFSTSKWRTK